MATFLKKLDRLLGDAEQRGLVDSQSSEALRQLAREGEHRGGLISLSAALGWLGAAALGLGVILVISANWAQIPNPAKIGGFLALFAAVHGAGLGLRWQALPYRRTAEALHTLGGILFIAGVGLISQIYHIDGNPPQAVLLWLLAIAPLAVLLASPGVTLLSLFALVLWFHLQGSISDSIFRVIRSFPMHLLFELGLGMGAFGLSFRVRKSEPVVGATLAACGIAMLTGALYLFGFYRHFDAPRPGDGIGPGHIWLPVLALGAGAAGLAAGWSEIATNSPSLRPRLLGMLAAVLVLGVAILGLESGAIAQGPSLEFFDFGWTQTFSAAGLIVSIAAWVLWFLIALACVAFGSTQGQPGYLNLGVAAVGLGVITRFFDLIGGLARTGVLFLVGGAVLLATAYATERWRKNLMERMRKEPS